MKTVLVTGGTTRLGLAISEGLRREGWRVLTSSHRADAGADLVADFTDPQAVVKAYAAALDLLGGEPPDALVNNAALFSGSEDDLRAVNLDAPKKLTMLMAGRETGCGAVVNILDTRVLSGEIVPQTDVYAWTKRELLGYTKSSAALFSETLRVNAVAPGPVLAPTDVHEKAGEILLNHRPTAADVAQAVSFLLSASSTTGAILPVDSGQHLLEVK